MHALYNQLITFLLSHTLKAILLAIAGYYVARFVSAVGSQSLKKHMTLHQLALTKRLIFYGLFGLFLVAAIQELGFHLGVLLGATGILTVAVGIASQTSMSNIISGFFILAERPFHIGDSIQVNDVQGEVMAIDFLSVKIRTSDNTMIRIPNEVLVKSAITNTSYFPVRRIDLTIQLSYKEDLEKVKKVLLNITTEDNACLTEPNASFTIHNFGDSAVQMLFSVWSKRENFSELKNRLQEKIKKEFMEAGIEMPFPSRTLYVSGNHAVLPIKNTIA